MPLPLIGLTAGNAPTADCDPKAPPLPRDAVTRQYSAALATAGAMPMILPLLHDPLPGGDDDDLIDSCGPGALHHNAEIYMDRLDGLLLCGGGDVALKEPNPPAHFKGVDRSRDHWEAALLAAALDRGKPVLGICRGVQLMNAALGGTLWGDLPSEYPNALEHHQNTARRCACHPVTLAPESRLIGITGAAEIQVNSIHHQAVREVAPAFKVAAQSPDGLIEALEHREAPFVIGVQWHPEALRAAHALALFRAFAAACAGA